jgi:intraflagellar transport protein 46
MYEQMSSSTSIDLQGAAISSEVADLFDHIGRYVPQDLELETPLEPFIPDYIPSVGDIDAFVKIARPDGRSDGLGLIVLDEPSGQQTDPTVLDLQLRVLSKQTMAPIAIVRSIENAEKTPKAISSWIASIDDLHRQKPPPTVSYSRVMPDVDDLMQLWPAEFEAVLHQVGWPATTDLQIDLGALGRLACAIVDIPVYNSLKESLHLLFTLYIEFKSQKQLAPVSDGISL